MSMCSADLIHNINEICILLYFHKVTFTLVIICNTPSAIMCTCNKKDAFFPLGHTDQNEMNTQNKIIVMIPAISCHSSAKEILYLITSSQE